SVDQSFQADADDAVNVILPLKNGKYLVGGRFKNIKGVGKQLLAVFNVDGTIDTSFEAKWGSLIAAAPQALGQQSDGKIIVGGGFAVFSGGLSFRLVARLAPDGTLDTSFSVPKSSSQIEGVRTLAVLPDDKIMIGGLFGKVDGQDHGDIARLNA